MDPTDTPNSGLGSADATSENPGEVAASSGPNPEGKVLQESTQEVTTVNLLSDVVQAPDVEPVMYNKDGSVRRKPGRKPGQTTGSGATSTAKVVQAKTPAQIKAQQVSSEQAAKVLINAGVGALVELIGPEWDFDSEDEALTMKLAVTGYIDSKGGANLSPEAMLFLTLSGYSLPRVKHPNTRNKFKAFFGGLWNALKRVKVR